MRQPDEDAFVLPDQWRDQIHVWRGGDVPPSAVPAEDAPLAGIRARLPEIRAALPHATGDPGLINAAAAYLAGAADPVGAAVVATIYEELPDHSYDVDTTAAFAHLWAAEHGLAFAAAAAVELGGVLVQDPTHGRGTPIAYRVTAPDADTHPNQLLGSGFGKYILRRTRTLLALAAEPDHRAALAALAERRHDDMRRILAAYLAPTEADWVAEAVAAAPRTEVRSDPRLFLLLLSLTSLDQLAHLHAGWDLWLLTFQEPLCTVAARLGPAIAPVVADLLDREDHDNHRKGILAVLGALPTDEAFDLLVARLDTPHVHAAVIAAGQRFPARALRRLAAAAAGALPGGDAARLAPLAARLLRGHVTAHPDLAAALRPEVPDEHRAALDAATGDTDAVTDAPLETLPEPLVRPLWTQERPVVQPVTVRGLTAPTERAVHWADGEQQRWAATRTDYGQEHTRHLNRAAWQARATALREGTLHPYDHPGFVLDAPEDLVRPLLATWRPKVFWRHDTAAWLKLVAARFGADALPAVLLVARSQPAASGEVLLPFVSAEVAELMADWLVRVRSARSVARAWLRRHRTAAVLALVPPALGRAGKRRRAAEAALRHLAATGSPAEVVELARQHGDQAAAGVESILAADPLADLPPTMPEVGSWLDVYRLPRVLLRDRRHALPASAVEHLVTMLALSWPHGRYAGIDVVREVCDPESLAEFVWALYEQSRADYYVDAKEDWGLPALGWLGNDDTVRRLAPLIRSWPGDGQHVQAVIGLDVLVAIGTDTALAHLNSIATTVKFKGLRAKAQERIAELADERGLSPEQLADRLVPDFGLDERGSLTLDYGPRRFTVGFDDQLKPFVTDQTGKRLRALPKPGVRDDPDLAPAAHQRFTALKKDVRTVSADQIRRLERAMVAQRRWSLAEFHDLVVTHPLVWHIARRLVWVADSGVSFRLAEDRTLADVHDDTLVLPAGAQVGIAHPVHLADTVPAWREVFADYAILQPFPQLERPVHALTDQERASTELTRFHDRTTSTFTVLGLERRGWERAAVKDDGLECWISRPLPDNRALVVNLSPGIAVGAVDYYPEQRVERVWLHDQPGTPEFPTPTTAFGVLDPVTASEVLADLHTLTTTAGS
ncbi:DUF4132 domain-containing protein [Goodfellowiella coeruleoviolacea]|uniref:DUF4132 domain-containing protein n=1 Tax=Goodfellowiella coeruleoviolacea TaxID=334858 RepID=A0AAE3KH58_9PSEU|nr:DUF4132 domain-containing protein [Goodfellowiella coeruleoviolacea]MCP2166129.1 protein of unknown function (DUF4132) [Goodfellowiella coeruleoviolacea]